jgi:hypothetical protein
MCTLNLAAPFLLGTLFFTSTKPRLNSLDDFLLAVRNMMRSALFLVLALAVSAQKMKVVQKESDMVNSLIGFCENEDPDHPEKVTVTGTFLDTCMNCEVDGECILSCQTCATIIDGQDSIKLPEISLADGCREFQNAGGELRCSHGSHEAPGNDSDPHFKGVVSCLLVIAIAVSVYYVYQSREESAVTVVGAAPAAASSPPTHEISVPKEGSML